MDVLGNPSPPAPAKRALLLVGEARMMGQFPHNYPKHPRQL